MRAASHVEMALSSGQGDDTIISLTTLILVVALHISPVSRLKWFVVSDKRTTKASELIFCLDSNNIPTSSKDISSSSVSYSNYFRSCTKPAPGPGGDKCEGEEREELPCAAATQCGQSLVL